MALDIGNYNISVVVIELYLLEPKTQDALDIIVFSITSLIVILSSPWLEAESGYFEIKSPRAQRVRIFYVQRNDKDLLLLLVKKALIE